jgi:sporulation protein YlmC with PRC-barrel domain
MIIVRIPQTLSCTLETTEDTTDRNDRLHVEMWVLGEHGKSLGTLDELQRDPMTGHVSGIIVRREIVSQRRLIPVSSVTAVTDRSVQIQMSRAAFKLQPQLHDG